MKLTEKQKNCPYCSPDKKVMMPIIADDSDFFAIENNGTISFGDDGSVTYYERLINFCPMCGRKLNNGKTTRHSRRVTNDNTRHEQQSV